MSSSDGLTRTDYMVLRAFVFRMWQQPVTTIQFEDLPEVITGRVSVADVEESLPRLGEYLFTQPVEGDTAIRIMKVYDAAQQPVIDREPENWPPVADTVESQRRLLRRIDDLLNRTGFPITVDELAVEGSFARSRTEVELMRLKRRGWIQGDGETFGLVRFPHRVLAITDLGKRELLD